MVNQQTTIELAPECCMICKRAMPTSLNPDPTHSWVYLAGSIPAGSMVCSNACLEKVLVLISETGRTDGILRSN